MFFKKGAKTFNPLDYVTLDKQIIYWRGKILFL